MSVNSTVVLIEKAVEEADRLGIGFYYQRLEFLVENNDYEGLFELVKHMEQMDEHDTSDDYDKAI